MEYLSRHLLEKGYVIHGGVRPGKARDTWRLDYFGIADKIEFVELDLGAAAPDSPETDLDHRFHSVPPEDEAALNAFLGGLGYRYTEESDNPAYRLFL